MLIHENLPFEFIIIRLSLLQKQYKNMKIFRTFLFCLLTYLICIPQIQAQDDPPEPVAPKKTSNIGQKRVLGIVFNRGFVMQGSKDASTPISGGRSGTSFLGFNYNVELGDRFGFRIQPGFSWVKYSYQQVDTKTFPSTLDTLDYEKHRLSFAEVPIGVYLNLTLSDDNKPQLFVEGGGFIGYMTGAILKTKGQIDVGELDQTIINKVRDTKDFERLRYGVYGKLGYKWIAIHFTYRLSDVFTEFATDVDGNNTTVRNPTIPPMEIGVSFRIFN